MGKTVEVCPLMFIADKKFILLLLVILLLGQVCWFYFSLSARPSFWWFDNLMHFLGGGMVASLMFGFLGNNQGKFSFLNNRLANWIRVISFVFLIGLFWEFYEYLIDIFWANYQMELGDTLSDLFFDLLGGWAVAMIYCLSKENPDLKVGDEFGYKQ